MKLLVINSLESMMLVMFFCNLFLFFVLFSVGRKKAYYR
ncbi:MAG: hypothetical protein JWP27_1344 [Flaviaesturariibacter sp.]|jgi:hypothetical protein|nr:hypothetical protein [Flaviaesturariibacter sp.]